MKGEGSQDEGSEDEDWMDGDFEEEFDLEEEDDNN